MLSKVGSVTGALPMLAGAPPISYGFGGMSPDKPPCRQVRQQEFPMTDRASIRPALGCNRIIPVLTVTSAAQGVAVARALAEGGVTVAEVTLRTAAGLDAIRAIRAECPDVLVGAGTVTEAAHVDAAMAAGAQFLVTPGTTAALRDALCGIGGTVPCLPGAVTISEMLTLRDLGFRDLKFFPAVPAGGRDFLAAVHGPCADLAFCPTGGISAASAADWLALPNVFAVGGTWLTPKTAMDASDMAAVTRLAREASAQ